MLSGSALLQGQMLAVSSTRHGFHLVTPLLAASWEGARKWLLGVGVPQHYPGSLLKVPLCGFSVIPVTLQGLLCCSFCSAAPPWTLSTEGPVSRHTGSPWLPGFGGQWWLNRAHIIGLSSTRPQLHGLQGTVGILWPLWLILVTVLSSPGHQPTAMFLLTRSCVALWTQALWIFSTWSPFNPPSSTWVL